MLFFGDRARTESPRAIVAELGERIAAARAAAAGAERHAAMAGLLARAGELAQGVADAEREAAGADVGGPAERAAMSVTRAAAGMLWRSWRAGGCAPTPEEALLAPFAGLALPDAIRVRPPEGFALYAVYPETYAAAATAMAAAAPVVVGIRSIGTALASMVAVGAGVTGAPFTVRPAGDPFRRAVALGPPLAAALASRRDATFAVVDEGPGLSGSSFAAVIDALGALDVPPDRVHLFPSHANPPGREADARLRAAHGRAPRHHVAFETLFLADGPLSIARLAEDVIGAAEGAPEDLGAGAWRRVRALDGHGGPPSQGWRERRKFLLRAGGRAWLARFVGIGAPGERSFVRARALAADGLVPPPAALRHGFLFEPWRADARAAEPAGPDRPALLAALRRHILTIARRFPATSESGASPGALLAALRQNAAEALGPGAAAGVERMARLVPEVARTARPVAIDGKLQAWEWLVLPGGRIEKADALDHHADHALVGCQDALWDVAGAELEFVLSPEEAAALAAAVRDATPGAPPGTLPFYRATYAATEVARWTLAAEDPGLAPEEARKRRAHASRAREALQAALSPATRG